MEGIHTLWWVGRGSGWTACCSSRSFGCYRSSRGSSYSTLQGRGMVHGPGPDGFGRGQDRIQGRHHPLLRPQVEKVLVSLLPTVTIPSRPLAHGVYDPDRYRTGSWKNPSGNPLPKFSDTHCGPRPVSLCTSSRVSVCVPVSVCLYLVTIVGVIDRR